MNAHLTKEELIKYQFELTSDDRAKEIAAHLEECARCRDGLEAIKNKFAALDVLQGQPQVSQELIDKVIAETRRTTPLRIRFQKPAWIGAAAAVLVIGLLLIGRGGDRETEKPFAAAPQELNEKTDSPIVRSKSVRPQPPKSEPASLGGIAHGAVATGVMPERPPFAPASAIELVTLPRRDNVQVTIYNSADLTLVREKRNLTLKKGWNWLQFMWANTLIDPTSLSLQPLANSSDIDIQQLVFPARLKDIGRWLIHSKVQGQVPFEITYFTSGLSWRAFYMGTLSEDERKMNLSGFVRVANNSGEDYENAQTRLIVGKVNLLDKIAELAKRKYPYNRPGIRHGIKDSKGIDKSSVIGNELRGYMAGDIRAELFDMDMESFRRKEIKKEGLSEYFLYTIEGTETLTDKWARRLPSFEAEDIPVESLYKYDESRWASRTIRYISFANDEDHELGETPIPNGNIKIYARTGDTGNLTYTGGANIKYIPVDEDIELDLGPARLVKIEPKLMDFATANYLFAKGKRPKRAGNIIGWDEIRAWKIEITNTRDLPAEIEITRGFGTADWTLEMEQEYEKYDAEQIRFNLNVAPRSKRTIEYTVTTYHGTRREELIESKNQ